MDSEIEIPVVPRPESLFSSLPKAIAGVAPGMLLMGFLIASERPPDEAGWIFGFMALFGLFLVLVIVTADRGHRPSVLRIEPGQIRWIDQGKEIKLPYEDLWVAYKAGRGLQERLVLGSRKALITIRTAFLPEAHTADSILEAVRERMDLLPEGTRKLGGIASRQLLVEQITSKRKTAVLAVSVLLGLVFLAQLVTGALADPLLLLAFGANSFPLVKDGEWFRLATANILHGSLIHFLFNIMALVNLGSFLEPLLGAGRFLTVLLASALMGAAGSAFLGHHALALGASTGIAGLIAVYVVILWRWPDRLSSPPSKGTWIWLAFALLWPALVFHNIDHMGHLAGFLAGLALVFPEIRKTDLAELANRRQALFRGTAALLAAVFLAAGWIAVRRAGDPDRDLKAASTLLQDLSLSPEMLNHLAWEVATRPEASQAHLAIALRGIERAVKDEPAEAAFRDTQATVLYRMHRWQEAIGAEYGLLAKNRTPFHVSQLARFEWALVRARGPLFLGQPPKVLPRARIAPDSSILIDAGDPNLLSGAVLHFVLSREEKAAALLMVTVGASETSGLLRRSFRQDFPSPRPDGISLALVDTRKTGAPDKTRWKLQPIVQEVASLP
jgi:rhomboid protease GluP